MKWSSLRFSVVTPAIVGLCSLLLAGCGGSISKAQEGSGVDNTPTTPTASTPDTTTTAQPAVQMYSAYINYLQNPVKSQGTLQTGSWISTSTNIVSGQFILNQQALTNGSFSGADNDLLSQTNVGTVPPNLSDFLVSNSQTLHYFSVSNNEYTEVARYSNNIWTQYTQHNTISTAVKPGDTAIYQTGVICSDKECTSPIGTESDSYTAVADGVSSTSELIHLISTRYDSQGQQISIDDVVYRVYTNNSAALISENYRQSAVDSYTALSVLVQYSVLSSN